ncbi:MAG: YcfL family protein [Shewanella sp.]
MNKIVLVLASALIFTACAQHSAGMMASSTGEVRVDNSRFAREVGVEQLKARQQGDLLQGSGVILSKISTDLRLQYKFTWYDIKGFTLEDDASPWKSLKLHGMQRMQVMAVAPNANAVRYELYVREAFSN